MPRPPSQHKRKQLRVQVRTDILSAFYAKIKAQNYLNPEKVAYSDMTKAIEPLLIQWLRKNMTPEEFRAAFATEESGPPPSADS